MKGLTRGVSRGEHEIESYETMRSPMGMHLFARDCSDEAAHELHLHTLVGAVVLVGVSPPVPASEQTKILMA